MSFSGFGSMQCAVHVQKSVSKIHAGSWFLSGTLRAASGPSNPTSTVLTVFGLDDEGAHQGLQG